MALGETKQVDENAKVGCGLVRQDERTHDLGCATIQFADSNSGNGCGL